MGAEIALTFWEKEEVRQEIVSARQVQGSNLNPRSSLSPMVLTLIYLTSRFIGGVGQFRVTEAAGNTSPLCRIGRKNYTLSCSTIYCRSTLFKLANLELYQLLYLVIDS